MSNPTAALTRRAAAHLMLNTNNKRFIATTSTSTIRRHHNNFSSSRSSCIVNNNNRNNRHTFSNHRHHHHHHSQSMFHIHSKQQQQQVRQYTGRTGPSHRPPHNVHSHHPVCIWHFASISLSLRRLLCVPSQYTHKSNFSKSCMQKIYNKHTNALNTGLCHCATG